MPSDIGLDTVTHDLALTAFDLYLVDDVDRVVQQIKIRLQFFLGEWFLNTGFGIPYFRDILIKAPSRAVVEGIFREEILGVPNVLSIATMQLQYDSLARSLQVTFTALTDFGLVNFSEGLEV